ncbi:MAG: nitroreductase [Bacteroidota bacterium]|nr:nitroreductase [Bacteroidota bacterium]MDP3145437.1 nitroreductase [Bacteroidota bacterium]MDP3557214.1 nitroreductase [Bacteroidota bacterium]
MKLTETKETSKSYSNEIIKTIFERRAVRKFKEKPVENEIILELLEAARMAPSAMNKQPWHFYILTDKEKIQLFSKAILHNSKLAMLKAGVKEIVNHILHPNSFHLKDGIDFFKTDDPIFHAAPVVIFISSDRSNDWAHLDVGMCAQNMMLAAKSLGLDSCPVGFAKFIENTDEYKKLNIPSSEEINLAIIIGYGNENPKFHDRKKDNATFINNM